MLSNYFPCCNAAINSFFQVSSISLLHCSKATCLLCQFKSELKSTTILRPTCVMAASITPLFLMRFAVGMLHLKNFCQAFDTIFIMLLRYHLGRYLCRNLLCVLAGKVNSSLVIMHIGFASNCSIVINLVIFTLFVVRQLYFLTFRLNLLFGS